MSEEEVKKGYVIPKRMVIVIMASLATAIQYTIRSNLSVTIVAMVNNTEPQESIDRLLNETQKSKIIGCPVPDDFLNSSHKAVQHELKGPKLPYTELETGGLLGSFFYGYIFTHVYAGQIASNFGPKKTIFVSLLLSGLFQLGTPYSTNFDSIVPITLRVLIGMSQGVMSPAIYTLFSNWVPKTELSLSFSFFTIGGYVGSILGVLLSGLICEYLDWRGVFYAFGLLALLFSVVWWFFVHDNPTKYRGISDAEIVKIYNGLNIPKEAVERNTISYKLAKDEKTVQKKKPAARKPGANVPWLKLLTSKEVWVVALAKFTLSWGNILLMSKLPSYLDRILHMPMQSNSMINAVIFFCLGVFALMFGALSDQIARKGWLSKLTSRKLFESIALFGSGGCLMLIPLAPCSPYIVVCLMIASSCFYAAMTGGDNVIVCDLTTTHSGSLYGITNAVGSLPGFLAPIFVGFLLSIDESIYHWNLIYIISGLIAFFGGIIFLLFASCEPLDLDAKPLLKTKLASMKSIRSIAADISIKPNTKPSIKESKSSP